MRALVIPASLALLVRMKSTGRRRRLEPGLYGPLPTFFDENQELDLISYKHHLLRESQNCVGLADTQLAVKGLARVGIGALPSGKLDPLTSSSVPVCMGSLGEASHLVGHRCSTESHTDSP